MESNLATIDRTFHDLALLEREEPKVSDKIKADAEKASKSVIAGFDITNEDAKKSHIEKARETRRSNVIKYLEKRSNFTGELNKLGVEPMAVLPSLAWVKLWKDAGLFYVSTTTGKVQCRLGPSAKQWMDQAYNRNYSKNATDLDRHRLEVASTYVKKYTLGTILEEMATDRCFFEGNNARIILPQAPADVIQTLIKVKALSPKTVAVPEAISFAGGAGQVIADMYKGANAKDEWARAQGYEDYKDWMRRDPIVFVEKGGVTAIVGQFGDFPIESELVDRVSKEDFFAEAEQSVQAGFYNQQTSLQQAAMQLQMNQYLYGQGGGIVGLTGQQYQGIGLGGAGYVTSGIPNTGWNVSTTYR
jgi:hypothetical protein